MKPDLDNKIPPHAFGLKKAVDREWSSNNNLFLHIFMCAVCPATGQTEASISPILSTDMMEKHLQQISDATPTGRYALVIMDCASWHSNKLSDRFNNLAIMHLPPYSPELNPIEQVWAHLRRSDLANFAFKNYEHIVEQLSNAWNKFRHQVDFVKSLCKRDWANLIIN